MGVPHCCGGGRDINPRVRGSLRGGGAIFSPQESGGEAILGMVKMLGAHSFERFRRLSSGGMKPKTIFAGAGVWREMRICIGIFFLFSFQILCTGGRGRTREDS